MADAIQADETPRLIASSKVEGTVVYDFAGERLGTISSFMVDKKSGQAEYAVMQFGGLLGFGSDHYPIPWSMLKYDVDRGGYVVDLDRDRLADAPCYASHEPGFDENYSRQVYRHYGVPFSPI